MSDDERRTPDPVRAGDVGRGEKMVRYHRDGWNRMVLDLGRGERPLRITLWPSRKRWWGVEHRPAVHQVRVHLGRLHITAGRFVWRRRR